MWHICLMEKTKRPPTTSGNEPATLHDLDVWGGELTARINALEAKMVTKDELQQGLDSLEGRIVHEFRSAVENIEAALKGANHDEISSLQDSKLDHEARITVLERRSGAR